MLRRRFAEAFLMLRGASVARGGGRDASRAPRLAQRLRASAVSPPAFPWAPPPPAGGAWHSVERWLVFSDLHLSAKTEAVCLQVLERVLSEARARRAGVLFLGDFWHSRGALPVPTLNAVLQALRGWDVPTLLLPGNHDQVDLGGEEHALTALQLCAPQHLHVFSAPALWRGALWLPYRREEAALGRALAAAAAEGGVQLLAVFAHADVAGAQLNEAHQARAGLPPAAFPQHVPVYTGHYHTPHTVAGTRITYVGSPYQVTAAEAGQQKRLMLLDSNWAHVQDVPMDLGPRHMQAAGAAPPPDLRPGDRLRWELGAEAEAAAAGNIERLRAAGVRVDVHRPAEAAARARIDAAERMPPLALLQAYCAAESAGEALQAACARFLEASAVAGGGASAVGRPHVHFEPLRLVMTGFGPFAQRTEYPLHERGLVVLTGRCEGGGVGGAGDSNGCGKTTLASAALWALKGEGSGAKSGVGGEQPKGALLVSDGAKSAEVRLEARLNGEDFWVERTQRARSGGFRWGLGGVDRTMQDTKLTKAALDALLPVDLLSATSFIGQHETEQLLVCNDEDFKAALGRLTGAEVWAGAREQAKADAKAADKRATGLAGKLSARRDEEARAAATAGRAVEAAAQRERELAARAEAAAAAAAPARDRLAVAQRALCAQVEELQAALLEAQPALASVEERLSRLEAAAAAARADADASASAAPAGPVLAAQAALGRAAARRAEAVGAEEAIRGRLSETGRALAVAAAARRAADAAVAAFAPLGALGEAGGAVCNACAQPLGASHTRSHGAALAAAAAARAAEAGAAAAAARDAEASAEAERCAAAEAEAGVRAAEAAERAAREDVRAAALGKERLLVAEAAGARARREHLRSAVKAACVASSSAAEALAESGAPAPAVAEVAEAAAAAAVNAEADSRAIATTISTICPRLAEAETALRGAARAAASAEAEVRQAAAAVNPLALVAENAVATSAEAARAARECAEEAEAAAAEERLSRAAEKALGPTGIQTYLLESMLSRLEAEANTNLGELSGGAMRLSLFIESKAKAKAKPKPKPKKAGAKAGTKSAAAAAAEAAAAEAEVEVEAEAEAEAAAGEGEGGGGEGGECVRKRVFMATPAGEVERQLTQLSGGERRRVALALQLAYSAAAAQRGGLSCGLLVLDEALQHLDPEGVARTGALLRRQHQGTVLLTAQSGSRALAAAAAVDVVVKRGAVSMVECPDAPSLEEEEEEEEEAYAVAR